MPRPFCVESGVLDVLQTLAPVCAYPFHMVAPSIYRLVKGQPIYMDVSFRPVRWGFGFVVLPLCSLGYPSSNG